NLDLAVAGYYYQDVTVLLGDGHGGFQKNGSLSLGRSPVALVAADFDRDGHLDLGVATRQSDGVTALLNDGNGTFRNAGSLNLGTTIKALLAGDFNGDGDPDLATANGRYLSYPFSN